MDINFTEEQNKKTPSESLAAHELTKQHQNEIRKQVQYYFSDENLKRDEFFYNTIKNSATGSIPIDSLLNCNKLKQLQAKKDDILQAISNSEELEVNGDGTGIKRKNRTDLPEFEPKVSKKVKTEKKKKKSDKEEAKGFDPKIFKITLSKTDPNVKWDKIEAGIESAYGVKIGYTRVNGTEGHIAIDQNELTDIIKQNLVGGSVKIQDIDVKIEECAGDDLKSFNDQHGKHLDYCLEKSKLKRKPRGENAHKDFVDFIFYNTKYKSLAPIKYLFTALKGRTTDDEVINEADQKLVEELLKYDNNYQEKSKDLKHFTVGKDPSNEQERCFFIVKNDGTKEVLDTAQCLENIKTKTGLPEDEE